jgi:hypothetical protein
MAVEEEELNQRTGAVVHGIEVEVVDRTFRRRVAAEQGVDGVNHCRRTHKVENRGDLQRSSTLKVCFRSAGAAV